MKQEATRICPSCKNAIVYKTVGHRNDAEKHNRVCRKCGYKSGNWKLQPNTECCMCQKKVYRIPSRLKEGSHFCSYVCRNKFYSKENSFVWKGGPTESGKRGRIKDWERRKNKKIRASSIFGGKCSICGYDKCLDALDFHHINPLEKDDNLKGLWAQKWSKIESEVKKCILLCSNCHREYHSKERWNFWKGLKDAQTT